MPVVYLVKCLGNELQACVSLIYLQARLEPLPHLAEENDAQLFSMNVYPDTSQLSRAYLHIIKHFEWEKFCVIYGDESGEWEHATCYCSYILEQVHLHEEIFMIFK